MHHAAYPAPAAAAILRSESIFIPCTGYTSAYAETRYAIPGVDRGVAVGVDRPAGARPGITRRPGSPGRPVTGQPDQDHPLSDWPRPGNPVARRVVEDAGRALGTLIGAITAITAPIKVLVSGEGVALASAVLDTAGEYARSVQHWTLPDVPIEITPFTFTEWAKGAAVIALRNQLDSALRPDS